jgi:hypothetical protein
VKALTIRQPWASLVALGVKHIETRTRPAPKAMIGQHFAVHAGCAQPPFGLQLGPWTIVDTPGRWVASDCDRHLVHDMPLGAIVATARLVACVPMVATWLTDHDDHQHCLWLEGNEQRVSGLVYEDAAMSEWPMSDQLPYGDFTLGRWAWLLDDVKSTRERCPACMRTPDRPGLVAAWGYCDTCICLGKCPPIPAKGQLGFWTWQP